MKVIHAILLLFNFQLDLQLQSEEGGDISSFIKNGEWQLKGMRRIINAFLFCTLEYYL